MTKNPVLYVLLETNSILAGLWLGPSVRASETTDSRGFLVREFTTKCLKTRLVHNYPINGKKVACVTMREAKDVDG